MEFASTSIRYYPKRDNESRSKIQEISVDPLFSLILDLKGLERMTRPNVHYTTPLDLRHDMTLFPTRRN